MIANTDLEQFLTRISDNLKIGLDLNLKSVRTFLKQFTRSSNSFPVFNQSNKIYERDLVDLGPVVEL